MSTFIEPASPKGQMLPGPKAASKSTPPPARQTAVPLSLDGAAESKNKSPQRRGSKPGSDGKSSPQTRGSKAGAAEVAATPPPNKNGGIKVNTADREQAYHKADGNLFRSPISPKTSARDILREHSSGAHNLEDIFNKSGVPIIQHKFRKALMGSIGSKPRLLTLSEHARQISLVKRDSNVNLRENVEDDDANYTFNLSEIVKITNGLSTVEIQKSLRKREKTDKKVAIAAERCFSIHWRSGRGTWDLEVAVGAPGFDGIAATAEDAKLLRDNLVEFLIAVAAGAMGGGGDDSIPTAPKTPNTPEPSTPTRGGSLFVKKTQTPSGGGKGEGGRPSNFRERKLSITNFDSDDIEIEEPKDEDGELYFAKEMDSSKSQFMKSNVGSGIPFDPSLGGTYSCHGIEQKFSRTGVQVKAKINQDRGGIQYPFGGRKDMAFFCVMDGHGRGGEKISEYCMSNLPKLLSEHPALHSNPAQALKESVVDVDNDLRKFLAREATFAGTTCICVLMVRDTLIMANSGDSRAVLGMVDPTTPNRVFAKDLSNDHKPDSPAEATRVRAMGGFVSLGSPERGPSRVWLNKAMNSCGLAMARSLGDHALANVGVIAEPEITTHTLGVHDKYLILGSDGIYEFIESKQACEIVHSVMTKKGGDADKACRLLIERSVIAWKTNEGDYRDDITGIVMKLPCINFSDIPPHPESTPTRRGSKF